MMHFPKFILFTCGLCGLGCQRSLVVDAHQRKNTTHDPYFLRMFLKQLIDDLGKLTASQVLIITVFSECDERSFSPAHMVVRAFRYEQGWRVGTRRGLDLKSRTGRRRGNNYIWGSWEDGGCTDG